MCSMSVLAGSACGGFFDTDSMEKEVPVYEFKVLLERGGKEFLVRSHELPDGTCNISSMLVGRGTLALHRAGNPYIRTRRGRSYMVEPHRGYEEQQVEYAQACLDVEKAALGIHSLSMEEQPDPPKPPESDPLGSLRPKHLPALAKIRDLLSEETSTTR